MHCPVIGGKFVGLKDEFCTLAAGTLQKPQIGLILELRKYGKSSLGISNVAGRGICGQRCPHFGFNAVPAFIVLPDAVGTISSGIRDISPLMEAE